MAYRPCSTPGCPELVLPPATKCPGCKRAMEARHRRNENANGESHRNPYNTVGHRRFRAAVLARDPRCVCMGECGRHEGICGRPATVADHWPRERVEIIQDGDNPDNPTFGRGVCVACHNAKTARTRNVLIERVAS